MPADFDCLERAEVEFMENMRVAFAEVFPEHDFGVFWEAFAALTKAALFAHGRDCGGPGHMWSIMDAALDASGPAGWREQQRTGAPTDG